MQWFEREFEFPFPTDIYPCLIERLAGLVPRVRAKVARHRSDPWTTRVEGRWSAQENLGHLTDLESLWQGRLDDFANGVEVLRPTDLENRRTHEANHNATNLDRIVDDLEAARRATLRILDSLAPEDFGRVSRHPRLDRPMRVVDLMFFVAEHDDHHLAAISAIFRTVS